MLNIRHITQGTLLLLGFALDLFLNRNKVEKQNQKPKDSGLPISKTINHINKL